MNATDSIVESLQTLEKQREAALAEYRLAVKAYFAADSSTIETADKELNYKRTAWHDLMRRIIEVT